MMLKKQALILLLSILAWTNIAHALGMGDIELNSNLNQPLDAEIELLQLRGLTAGEILPALASNDAFRRAGVERSFFLSNIRFDVREDGAGNLIIGLSTSEPVREPFLNFLVEVNWPGGRLLKEFTILLDPPVFDTGDAGDSLVIDSATTSSGAVTELTTTTTVSSSETETQTQPAQVEQRQENLASDQYRVQRNDTLWEIAQRIEAGSGYSPQQVMMAIQDLNPDAFINSNINRLKAGSLLNLPDESQIARRSLQEAVNAVRLQNEGQSARPRTDSSEAQDVQLSATDSTSSALPDGDEGRDPDGYLEVAPGEAEGTSAGGDATAQAQVAQLQSELAEAGELADQFEREKQELESRVAQLEEQISIMQRLLNVQSTDAATLQSELADQQAAAEDSMPEDAADSATSDPTLSQVEGQEPLEAESGSLDSMADSEAPGQSTAQSDTDSVLSTQPEPSTVPQPEATPEPAPMPKPEPVQPVSDPGFMGFIRDFTAPVTNWVTASVTNMIITGAGAIILLLLPTFIRSRFKKDADDDDITDIDDEVLVSGPAAVSDTDDHDFGDDLLADFEDDDEPAEFDTQEATDEVSDALMEAEMYMAYQKFDQAEEKLKSAFAEQPERVDIGLKLLEVYAETGNSNAFEDLATRLSLSAEQERQVAELRNRMPILGDGDDHEYSMDANADSDLDFGSEMDDEESPSLDDLEADLRAETGSYDLSDFDAKPTEANLETATDNASDDLDFSLDLDDLDLSDSDVADDDTPHASTSDSLGDLEFDLDDEDFAAPGSSSDVPEKADSENDGIDFNLEDDGSGEIELDFSLDDVDAESESEVEPKTETGSEVDSELETEESSLASPASLDLDDIEALDEPAATDEDDLSSPDFGELEDISMPEDTEGEVSLSESPDLTPSEEGRPQTDTDASPESDFPEEPEEDDLQDLADALPGTADLDDDEFDFLSGNDEASTKLDLARAYIEMDDKEGARDILEEVVTEGDDEQKRQAKELMDQL